MPFSHHSHSGTFCPGHAQDSLEEVIETAVSKGFRVFALTEHMPRHDQDRYPEEIEAEATLQSMIENEARYVTEAHRLRDKYQGKLSLPIGFESEWCGSRSLELIHQSLQSYPYDFFMGSIHHVRGVPIDYDEKEYVRARDLVGGTDQQLFEAYFDEQLDMLQALRPPVVGHLDLIRLKSDSPNIDWQSMQTVWAKILRNLDFIASYGGILEINTAALRKGMTEPYPKSEICKVSVREYENTLTDRFFRNFSNAVGAFVSQMTVMELPRLQPTITGCWSFSHKTTSKSFIISTMSPNLEIQATNGSPR